MTPGPGGKLEKWSYYLNYQHICRQTWQSFFKQDIHLPIIMPDAYRRAEEAARPLQTKFKYLFFQVEFWTPGFHNGKLAMGCQVLDPAIISASNVGLNAEADISQA